MTHDADVWNLSLSRDPRGDWFLDVTAPVGEDGVAQGCSFPIGYVLAIISAATGQDESEE